MKITFIQPESSDTQRKYYISLYQELYGEDPDEDYVDSLYSDEISKEIDYMKGQLGK